MPIRSDTIDGGCYCMCPRKVGNQSANFLLKFDNSKSTLLWIIPVQCNYILPAKFVAAIKMSHVYKLRHLSR